MNFQCNSVFHPSGFICSQLNGERSHSKTNRNQNGFLKKNVDTGNAAGFHRCESQENKSLSAAGGEFWAMIFIVTTLSKVGSCMRRFLVHMPPFRDKMVT